MVANAVAGLTLMGWVPVHLGAPKCHSNRHASLSSRRSYLDLGKASAENRRNLNEFLSAAPKLRKKKAWYHGTFPVGKNLYDSKLAIEELPEHKV